MASEIADLKVVRCTFAELKQFAEQTEKSRGGKQKSKRTDLLDSVEKGARSSGHEEKFKKERSAYSSEERRQPERRKKNMAAEKRFGSSQKKSVATKSSEKGINNNKNGIVNGDDAKDSHRNVRFEVEYARECSSDNNEVDYDRGLVSTHRFLYKPSSSNDGPYSSEASLETRHQDFKNEPPSNIKLADMMESLKANDNKHLSRVKKDDNLRHSETTKHYQTSPKKSNKKIAETLLVDIKYLETDLGNLLSRRINSAEQLMHVVELSHQVQEKCKAIMLMDLFVFTTKEVHHILWRSCVYQVVERLRTLQKTADEEWLSEISCTLQEFLESTCIFLNSLVTNLENKHDFSLKCYLNAPNQYDNCSRLVKMALLSCHHFMIFLGDIERYKQNLSPTKDWSLARSYYLKASKIAPKNGKPYNQLAVLAVYAKRRLHAVYYYVRSLTVRNSILTAREKLHAIFDDVQRKAYELHMNAQMEQQRLAQENASRPQKDPWSAGAHRGCTSDVRRRTEEGRHELWVFYQSGTRREFLFTPSGLLRKQEKGASDKKEKPNGKMSLNEINKQFEIFYLYCHAMLYSKTGVDHFIENHRKTLGLFRTLLRHPTSQAVGMKRLVEIMAINMFAIENLVSKDIAQIIEGTPLDFAVNLGCDIFQCLCKATCDFIKPSENTLDEDIRQLVLTNYVPAIKVWFDWLHEYITLLRSSSVSIKEEFWNCIAVLLNDLREIYDVETSSDNVSDSVGEVLVRLPEDEHLNGFNLLAEATKPQINIVSPSEKEMACGRLRNEAINSIAKFLCEFEDLPLRLDNEIYYVTAIMASPVEHQESGNEISENDIDDNDVIVESVEEFDSDSELPNHVQELKAKKDALTKEILNQKQREEDAQAVLVEHSSKSTLVLEINPQYLVPDTNCFIDHLSDLQYIIESRYFTIVIPLVVVNELDGLAKGSPDMQSQRTEYVAMQARAAVDFLEYSFSLSDSQMLALTSKGSVLTTIAFRSEEPTAGRSINDDIILKCCSHYCDAKVDVVNKLGTADQPFTITRKVVLLTEDRNLRLKAHVQNIPVVTVPQFLEMIVG